MKQLISAALLLTATLLFTSCEKRDYNCSCKLSDGTTKQKWIGFMPNNNAQKICNDYQLELKDNPNGIVPICKVTY
jgi:hypothetical protein